MSDLRIRLEGGPQAQDALKQRVAAVQAAIRLGLQDSVDLLSSRIARSLRGAILHVKIGRLWQSIAAGGFVAADGLSGGVGTNVEYAKIHEFGGFIRPHTGKAPNRFGGGFHLTSHPGATMPARPYMRPGLEESREDIRKVFVGRLTAALKGSG